MQLSFYLHCFLKARPKDKIVIGYGVNATEGITAIGKGKSEIVSDYEKFLKKCNTENIVVPSFFEMIRDYIIEHFDRAGDVG